MSAAYASLSDLTTLGVSPNALTGIANAQQQEALNAACDIADSYLASRYVLPLAGWGFDLRQHVCAIAAYTLLVVRGYNPDDGADKNLRKRYEDALEWLKGVSEQEITPAGVSDSSSHADGGLPFVVQSSVETTPYVPPSQVVASGPPPSVSDQQPAGYVVTGPPRLRGW